MSDSEIEVGSASAEPAPAALSGTAGSEAAPNALQRWFDRAKDRPTVAYLWSLVGRGSPTSIRSNPNEPHGLGERSDDWDVVIDEGRRQTDRQFDTFEAVRGRAQDRITVTLVVLAFNTTVFVKLGDLDGWHRVAATAVWTLSFALVILSLAMAAAVASVRGDFEMPDTTQLTDLGRYPAPIKQSLAEDYARSVKLGAVVVADRVNALQITTLYLVWGALATAVGYLVAA